MAIMWEDELFDEIQKGDRVFYETAQGQTQSGVAVILGPMGWVCRILLLPGVALLGSYM